jgi:hypothetical protein
MDGWMDGWMDRQTDNMGIIRNIKEIQVKTPKRMEQRIEKEERKQERNMKKECMKQKRNIVQNRHTKKRIILVHSVVYLDELKLIFVVKKY